MGTKYRVLDHEDRRVIEALYNKGIRVSEIAKELRVHRSTIYRELKRGMYMHTNEEYIDVPKYSCDIAQQKSDFLNSGRGKTIKLAYDYELASFIEHMIADKGFSPEATLLYIKEHNLKFDTTLSFKTIYRYIDQGVFYRLTNKTLRSKGKRKMHPIRRQKRASAGTSIKFRPKEIDFRKTFGHWEMDTVKGNRGSKGCILVLSERKTRYELMVKLTDQSSKSVVSALDKLNERLGDNFSKIFKTITVDNGVEFSDVRGISKNKRTYVYYCHAYCSCERGTNENINRMIRWHIPKGSNLDKYSQEDFDSIEDWINHYPRGIFNGRCSADLFQEELASLNLSF